MRTCLLKWSMVAVFALITTARASALNLPAPGMPCTNVDVSCALTGITASRTAGTTDPSFVLPSDPGVVNLGIFVVPGDVLLLETSGNPSDPKTWSDVVEFSDSPTGGGSIATTFPDVEGFGVVVPPGFTPSLNNFPLQETLTGDSTPYTAGTASYEIHSDCAGPGCEITEPTETPEPSSLLLLGTGLLVLAGTVRRKLLS